MLTRLWSSVEAAPSYVALPSSPRRHSRSFSGPSTSLDTVVSNQSQEADAEKGTGNGQREDGMGRSSGRLERASPWSRPLRPIAFVLTFCTGFGFALLAIFITSRSDASADLSPFPSWSRHSRGDGVYSPVPWRSDASLSEVVDSSPSIFLLPLQAFASWSIRDILRDADNSNPSRTLWRPVSRKQRAARRKRLEERKQQREPRTALGMRGLTRWEGERSDMSQMTCEREFGLFGPLLEDSMRYWSERGAGGISKGDVDEAERGVERFWGWARILVEDNKLYIRSLEYSKLPTPTNTERLQGILYLIHLAVSSVPASDPPLPPVDMVISTADRDGDGEEHVGWALARRVGDSMKGVWLLPDYGFAAWPSAGIPSFGEVWRQMDEVEERTPWADKDSRAFWRGLPNHYPIRDDLVARTSTESAQVWADVRSVELNNIPVAFKPEKGWSLPASIPSHCGHKFLIHAEGNSYSGRLKYLLSCGGGDDGGDDAIGSVAIAHKQEWQQHFHVALSDQALPIGGPQVQSRGLTKSHSAEEAQWTTQNMVTVPGPGFEGLEETVKSLQKDDDTARQIARNAARTLRHRYLTPAATTCYVRSALRAYGLSIFEGGYVPEVRVGGGVRKPPGDEVMEGDMEYGSWITLGMPERPGTVDKR